MKYWHNSPDVHVVCIQLIKVGVYVHCSWHSVTMACVDPKFLWLWLELCLSILCRAVKSRACGVPSFVVDDGPLIWGQDSLNVIQDMMCGWTQSDHTPSIRLWTSIHTCVCVFSPYVFTVAIIENCNRVILLRRFLWYDTVSTVCWKLTFFVCVQKMYLPNSRPNITDCL